MSVPLRRLVGLLAAALMAIPLALMAASPASAAVTRCTPHKHEMVCIQQEGWWVRGMLLDRDASNGISVVANVTVALQQCQGNGANCGNVAAVHDVITPWRQMIPGHAYRVVASWRHVRNPLPAYDAVFVVSPWAARPCPC